MNKLFNLKTVLLTSSFLITSAFASEQPAAEDLVGKFYGGAHLIYIDTDYDRALSEPLDASAPYSTKGHGTGFGAELGYRFTESLEARASLSQINIDKNNSSYDKPYISDFSALYFPDQKNFYLLAGVGYLDTVQHKESINLGAGYRYYLSERSAVYLEAKAHYEFQDHYQDTTTRVGFIYFFGGDDKSMPVRKKEASIIEETELANTDVVAAVLDDDNDGVSNENDNCANTPATHKVDVNGCTLFSNEKNRVKLLVNFDNNKAIVKSEFLPEIEKMADVLKTYPDVSLVIEGHSSKAGTDAYNKVISQKRADAIVNVLVNEFGISSSRLSSVGYGSERLLDQSNSREASALNRRIEAKVVVTKKVAITR